MRRRRARAGRRPRSPHASSALASLMPPRETNCGRSSTRSSLLCVHQLAGLHRAALGRRRRAPRRPSPKPPRGCARRTAHARRAACPDVACPCPANPCTQVRPAHAAHRSARAVERPAQLAWRLGVIGGTSAYARTDILLCSRRTNCIKMVSFRKSRSTKWAIRGARGVGLPLDSPAEVVAGSAAAIRANLPRRGGRYRSD